MQIQVKLMGVLKKRTPPGGTLELEDGSTISDALAALDLPNKRINAVSLNGEVERNFAQTLKAGDELIVLPPVGGGSSGLLASTFQPRSELEQGKMKLEITIDVDDLERAVEFYCDGLGLVLVEQTPDWAWVELNGQTFWICTFGAGPHGPISRDFRRHWTPVHLDFIVDDVDKAVERALAAGGRLDREIRRNEPEPIGCRSDVANLSDPAGNGVDLLQRHLA